MKCARSVTTPVVPKDMVVQCFLKARRTINSSKLSNLLVYSSLMKITIPLSFWFSSAYHLVDLCYSTSCLKPLNRKTVQGHSFLTQSRCLPNINLVCWWFNKPWISPSCLISLFHLYNTINVPISVSKTSNSPVEAPICFLQMVNQA